MLVLDAGGGTTDCTLMRLGPGRKASADRTADILSTSGERLGGTDLDVAFAKQFFGPAFGIGAHFKSGRPIPASGILDVLSITDIPAQTRFYGRAMGVELGNYLRDAALREPVERLIELRGNHLAMRVNRSAESGKIALSDREQVNVALMQAACSQAGEAPDEIFITGGTSRIPLLNRMVREQFPGVPIVSGDNFGSVCKGLALRAQAIAGSSEPA